MGRNKGTVNFMYYGIAKQQVAFKKLNKNAKTPSYGSEYAAGADLYACIETEVTVNPGETKFIPTGLALEIPIGLVGLVYARSGLACKKGRRYRQRLPRRSYGCPSQPFGRSPNGRRRRKSRPARNRALLHCGIYRTGRTLRHGKGRGRLRLHGKKITINQKL